MASTITSLFGADARRRWVRLIYIIALENKSIIKSIRKPSLILP